MQNSVTFAPDRAGAGGMGDGLEHVRLRPMTTISAHKEIEAVAMRKRAIRSTELRMSFAIEFCKVNC